MNVSKEMKSKGIMIATNTCDGTNDISKNIKTIKSKDILKQSMPTRCNAHLDVCSDEELMKGTFSTNPSTVHATLKQEPQDLEDYCIEHDNSTSATQKQTRRTPIKDSSHKGSMTALQL